MIDSRITGAYISRLRRDKDWTQMALADELNISHQAVSRWETGDSFPDIATLAQMAGLFGVTVDDLLNGGQAAGNTKRPPTGQVLVDMAHGRTENVTRLVRDDPSNLEAVIDAAPLSRPSQLNDVLANLGDVSFSSEQVVALAPFVPQEMLHALVGQIDPSGMTLAGLTGFAPFVDHETLDSLAKQVVPETIAASDLVPLAPFLGRALCNQLAERMTVDSIDEETLLSLAPFIDRQITINLLYAWHRSRKPL